MANLEVGNEYFYAHVFEDTKLNFQLVVNGQPDRNYIARKNHLVVWSGEYFPDKPYLGVMYYAMPCVFERLRVQRVEDSATLYDASDGGLPDVVQPADLAGLPGVRVLEEIAGKVSWRLDRRYTLVGRYLVFDAEQLYRRHPPGLRKGWETIRAELRQVVDVVGWGKGETQEDHSVIRLVF